MFKANPQPINFDDRVPATPTLSNYGAVERANSSPGLLSGESYNVVIAVRTRLPSIPAGDEDLDNLVMIAHADEVRKLEETILALQREVDNKGDEESCVESQLHDQKSECQILFTHHETHFKNVDLSAEEQINDVIAQEHLQLGYNSQYREE